MFSVDGPQSHMCGKSEDAVSTWSVLSLPYDVIMLLWTYHYVFVVLFLVMDGLLKLADWLLDGTLRKGNNKDSEIKDTTSKPSTYTGLIPDDVATRRKDSATCTTDDAVGSLPHFDRIATFDARQSQTPPFKSKSMTEADRQRAQPSPAEASRPVAVHYYYGKLIQVNSPQQIQIGDYNKMEVTALTDEDSEEDLLEDKYPGEDSPNLANQTRSKSCSELLDHLTDDQKSLARSDSHNETDSDSRRHSLTTSTLPTSQARYGDSSASLSSDTSSPGLSEELFVEARFKIFKAAEEYRKSKQEKETLLTRDEKRGKSLKFYKRKK